MTTLLQQAIDLANAGNREEAEALLQRLVAEQPDNEAAWMWLSGVTKDKTVKARAINQALALNPDNSLAQEGSTRFSAYAETGGVPDESSFSATDSLPEQTSLDFDTTSEVGKVEQIDLPDETTASSAMDNFDFSFEENEHPIANSAVESASSTEELDWENFDFDAESPFDIDLDKDTGVSVETSELDTTPKSNPQTALADDDAFDFDSIFNAQDEQIDDTISDSDPLAALFSTQTEATSETETLSSPEATSPAEADIFDWGSPATSLLSDKTNETPSAEGSDMGLSARLNAIVPPEAATDSEETMTNLADENVTPMAQDGDRVSEQRQSRSLMPLVWGGLVLVFMVLLGAVLWLFDDVVGRYTLLPPPPELTERVPVSNDGVTVLNFKGYPAKGVKLQWREADSVPTCTTPGVGISVNFGTGDAFTVRNDVCSGGNCSFEKMDLNGGSITQATVMYACSADATITLLAEGQ